MSVAEFVLAASASIPIFFATHECVRLYSIHRSAEVLLFRHVSEVNLSALSHTKEGTFLVPAQRENVSEIRLKNDLKVLAHTPLLKWQWSTGAHGEHVSPLVGLKVSLSGPSQKEPLRDVEAHITLCVQSWLEPLVRIATDGRSCVGEYLSDYERQQSTTRGIALKLSAWREVPATVYIFQHGIYSNAHRVPGL